MNQDAKCQAGGDDWCCLSKLRRPTSTMCEGHQQQRRAGVPYTPLRFRSPNGVAAVRQTTPCEYPGCPNRKVYGLYCGAHQMQKHRGTPLRPIKQWVPSDTLPGWSQPWVETRGYAWVSRKNGIKRAEHRVVMELMIGRELLPDENVHHLNGVRHDNRPENLELWSTLQPPGQRIHQKVDYAWELIRRYDPDHKREPGAISNTRTSSW